MEKMTAYCGLNCTECATLIATREDDDEKRKKVAAEWSKLYQAPLKPEEMYCDGCLSTNGRLFRHCAVCDIRICGLKKAVANCAHCDDYACDKLNNFFALAPQTKDALDQIRKGLSAK
ncbi:MAG: DUF3795 domain-containing protein [Deltaproteobacteria bacterium]|nr:DUF3795 domain-containing protein [Deltaproteobacteria bacterium]